MTTVLVTGASGAVGVPVCDELSRRGHRVVKLDLRANEGDPDVFAGSIEDPRVVARAMSGVECIVHLAGEAHDVPFERLIGPNVMGLFRVLDAARQAGVRRIVLASTIQVVGSGRDESVLGTEASSPTNHYALTKVWAEHMGAMYSRCFGLSILCARIAWMVRDVGEARRLHEGHFEDLYLSRRDVGRFMALAVEAGEIPFAVLYAASRGGERLWDMEPARRLIGYEAQDRFPEGLGLDFDASHSR